MYVSNEHAFGHLVNAEDTQVEWEHCELWEVERNPGDWERRYLHPQYARALEHAASVAAAGTWKTGGIPARPRDTLHTPNATTLNASMNEESEPESVLYEPCQDVYWFPLYTPLWARHLIDVLEQYTALPGNSWSDGTNNDARLEGEYTSHCTNERAVRTSWSVDISTYCKYVKCSLMSATTSSADVRIVHLLYYAYFTATRTYRREISTCDRWASRPSGSTCYASTRVQCNESSS